MATELPLFELGNPGPLRDRLVAAALSGEKTATSALLVFFELEDEALPVAGSRAVLVDSAGAPVALVELLAVCQVRLGEVDDAIAWAEGEGFADVRAWRRAHENFWRVQLEQIPGGAAVEIDDDSIVVVEMFRLVAESSDPGSPAPPGD
jgi:uncharacterized protein YhfF